MKTTKNYPVHHKVFLTLCALLVTQHFVSAQTLVQPSNTPTVWYNNSSPVLGVNTAELYGHHPAPVFGGSLLFGSTYWDGTTAQFIVDDWGFGSIGLTGLASTPTGLPDIVIGNTAAATAVTDYIVAVAYPTSTGVEVDCYDMYDDGVSTYSVSATPTCTYTYTTTGTVSTVHIDVNVDYNNTTTTNVPYCRYAFVTWDDLSTGIVYVDHIDLQATGSLTPTATLAGNGMSPDVAGVFRGSSGPGDEVALLTYTDATSTNLYYREWDFTASALSGVTTMDALPIGYSVTIPRIDANDDFATNHSTNANYEIVAQVYNNGTGFNEIRSYNNFLGAGAHYTSSNVVSSLPAPCNSMATYDNFTPTVALGGKVPSTHAFDGTQYMIAHFTDDGGSPNDIVFMEPVNDTTAHLVNPPNKYYWVSEDISSMTTTSGNYAASVSTPCNVRGKNSLIAWAYPDGVGGSNVEYKISPNTYAYRDNNSTATAIEKHQLNIYPNPAGNILAVANVNAAEKTTYSIINMLGICVGNGALDNSGIINVAGLAPGTYILKLVYSNNTSDQGIFAKM